MTPQQHQERFTRVRLVVHHQHVHAFERARRQLPCDARAAARPMQFHELANYRQPDAPPCRRAADPSACWKRSNTCGRNSGAILSPLALTTISTREFTRSRATWIFPCCGWTRAGIRNKSAA